MDQRNAIKFDEHGKIIKRDKSWKPAKPLHPKEHYNKLNYMLTWFFGKFKPFSNHLFNYIAFKPIKQQKTEEEIKSLAENVRNDMEHLR